MILLLKLLTFDIYSIFHLFIFQICLFFNLDCKTKSLKTFLLRHVDMLILNSKSYYKLFLNIYF